MDKTVEEDFDTEKLRDLAEQRLGLELEGAGELESLIGIGSIAAVYQASGAGRGPVAVKILHEHLKSNDNLRDRFRREAKILNQAEHPNAIRVFDAGETDKGVDYFVMELLEGREVGDILWHHGPLSVGKTLGIGAQTLDCLAAYHEAGVLHRDLKPANLFLTYDGIVKLLDFGLARFRVEGREKTKAGTKLGTPAYMAPEQARGHQDMIDERTDIFGIGAVMYELLSGRAPHEADSVQATMIEAASSSAESLARHVSDVPDAVIEVVDRAIAYDPDDRFASAAEMRDAICALVDSDLLIAPDDERLDRGKRVDDEQLEESSRSVSSGQRPGEGTDNEFTSDPPKTAEVDQPGPEAAAAPSTPEVQSPDDDSDLKSQSGTTKVESTPGPSDAEEGAPSTGDGEGSWPDEEDEQDEEDDQKQDERDEAPSIVMEAEALEERLDDDSPPGENDEASEERPDVTPAVLRMAAAVRRGDGQELADALDDGREQLRRTQEPEHDRFVWRIYPHAIELETGDRHDLEDDLEDLGQELLESGFYRLMLDASVEPEELRRFVEWLGSDPWASLPGEDDLATRFREQQFESVGAGIYPVFRWDDRGDASFREEDQHAELAEEAVRYLHGKQGMWRGLEDLTTDTDPSGLPQFDAQRQGSVSTKIDSQADDFLRTPKGILPMDVASKLNDTIDPSGDDLLERAATLFGAIWNDGDSTLQRPTASLGALFASQVDRNRGRQSARFLWRALRHVEDRSDRQSLVAAAFDDVDVERFIQLVGDQIDDARRSRIADALAEVCEHLPASRRAEIIATYEFGDDFTRTVLEPYRQRFNVAEDGSIQPAAGIVDDGSDDDASTDDEAASEGLQWRRAFAGEVYRLYRTATSSQGDREEVVEQATRRLSQLLRVGPDRLSLLFADDRILVNGSAMRGSPSSYDALETVGDFLEGHDCNEIELGSGLDQSDVGALLDQIAALRAGDAAGPPPFEPTPRVRIDSTAPADRFGMIDPLVGDMPLEMRIGRYYAGCATTLNQYLRTSPKRRPEWFPALKSMAQIWVRLTDRSRPTALALTGMNDETFPVATHLLDSTLLALTMARRLTGRRDVLTRVAWASLATDPGRLDMKRVDPEHRRWNSAAETASAVLSNAAPDSAAIRRAITTFEVAHLVSADADSLPYGNDLPPKLETMLVATAREYDAKRRNLIPDEAPDAPRKVIESMARERSLKVERYLLRLLADSLGLFTRGMEVELSSGWRGVVLESQSHLTDFHLPRVRLQASAEGESVSPRDVDLAVSSDDRDEYGHVVRRLRSSDRDESPDIKDSMTDSIRQSGSSSPE